MKKMITGKTKMTAMGNSRRCLKKHRQTIAENFKIVVGQGKTQLSVRSTKPRSTTSVIYKKKIRERAAVSDLAKRVSES
jgi:hypothetical protein